jgi:predicted aspartyl protease
VAVPDTLAVSEHFPYVRVIVTVRGQAHAVEALLDTGYSGYVVMPEGALKGASPLGIRAIVQVADGRKIGAPVYEGKITVGDVAPFDALVTVLGNEPIVGRQVIRRFKVILDHGTRVTLEL